MRAVNANGQNGATSLTSVTAIPRTTPSAPTNLSIIPGNGQITIIFTDASANGSDITNYEYSEDGSSNWTAVNPATATLTSPAVITPLNNGQSYTYYLRAVNGAGNGATSSTSVTATPYVLLPAPTNLSAKAGNGKITIYFTAGSANGSTIADYEYSADGSFNWKPINSTTATTASPAIITGLDNGTSYTYYLRAVNANGQKGATSLTSITDTPCTTPAAPIITNIIPGYEKATIYFTDGSNNGAVISNYKYSMDGGLRWIIRFPESKETPIIVSNLENGTDYNVKILAINKEGEGAISDGTQVKPGAAPNAPTLISVDGGDSAITINFSANGENGYAIDNYRYSVDNGINWDDSSGNITSPIEVSTLENGTPYFVIITAVNEKGESLPSGCIEVTPAKAPEPPIIDNVTSGNGTLSIYFHPGNLNGSNITNYKYSTNGGLKWTLRNSASAESPIELTSSIVNGTPYSIALMALSNKGDSSGSNVYDITAATIPAKPIITKIKEGNETASIYFVAGAANGSAIIKYLYATDSSGTNWKETIPASTTSSPIVITDLSNNQTYYIRLKAENGKGEGPPSNVMQVIPAKAPAAPTITDVSGSENSITIKFTEGANNGSPITNYKYSTNGGLKWTLRRPVSAVSPLIVSRLTTGVPYSVKIKAINAKGVSVESVEPFSITL